MPVRGEHISRSMRVLAQIWGRGESPCFTTFKTVAAFHEYVLENGLEQFICENIPTLAHREAYNKVALEKHEPLLPPPKYMMDIEFFSPAPVPEFDSHLALIETSVFSALEDFSEDALKGPLDNVNRTVHRVYNCRETPESEWQKPGKGRFKSSAHLIFEGILLHDFVEDGATLTKRVKKRLQEGRDGSGVLGTLLAKEYVDDSIYTPFRAMRVLGSAKKKGDAPLTSKSTFADTLVMSTPPDTIDTKVVLKTQKAGFKRKRGDQAVHASGEWDEVNFGDPVVVGLLRFFKTKVASVLGWDDLVVQGMFGPRPRESDVDGLRRYVFRVSHTALKKQHYCGARNVHNGNSNRAFLLRVTEQRNGTFTFETKCFFNNRGLTCQFVDRAANPNQSPSFKHIGPWWLVYKPPRNLSGSGAGDASSWGKSLLSFTL